MSESPRAARIERSGRFLLIAVYAAGAILTLRTLQLTARLHFLLQVILAQQLPALVVGPLSWILLAGVVLVLFFGFWDLWQLLRRWRLGLDEPFTALRLRVAAYFVAACIVLNVGLLSDYSTLTGPDRVRFPMISWIISAGFFGAYLIWSHQWERFGWPSARVRRLLDVALANLVLGAVLLEILFRVLGAVWATPLLVTDSSSGGVRRSASVSPPGSIRFGFPIHDYGHYDIQPDPGNLGRPLIASISDSFAYGTVPLPFHFTSMAEENLAGSEFYNMGYPETGPSDYRYLLTEEALGLDPDLVVVNLFLGNDLTDGPTGTGPPGLA